MMKKQENQWKEIDENNLTVAERCVYQSRRRALELYQTGKSAKEIFLATGIRLAAVRHLWKRCCEKDPETGECCGYQALIPKSKIKRFIR
ncbi:MAG: hypothetical protein HFG49_06305 [Lachnospiraceae bacterium]|jgi:hypothetical protein|nr:hypothetical protein [Lachnospiraceae bacterium]